MNNLSIWICAIGTPSLAEPETIQAILTTVASQVHFPAKAEVTLELNPTSFEAANLRFGDFFKT